MHVLTIIGNRPQFVKLAAVSPLLRERHRETLVHTGQHHDRELSDVFFDQLNLPAPDHQLAIAGGSNTSQTARMLEALEPIVLAERPDVILVYGDTNSTLAGALVAAQTGTPLAHVEAGLRSWDRAMPEEVNRVVCDALADLLLAPGDAAAANLAREGVAGDVVVTGDVMGDVVLAAIARGLPAPDGFAPGAFYFVTAHRAANVDDPARLAKLVDLLVALELSVLFPVHPRTHVRLVETGELARLEGAAHVTLAAPMDYAATIGAVAAARAVLTDSGGLQKEAVWCGTRCITLRPNTEWTETEAGGWNTVTDLDSDRVSAALATPPVGDAPSLYNAGAAGRAVVDAISGIKSS